MQAERPVHAAAAGLRGRPGADPHPRRRPRGGAQLQHPRHEVAVRAVGAQLRLPQQPDDGHLGALRVRHPAARQERPAATSSTTCTRRARSTDDLWNGLWGLLRAYNGNAHRPACRCRTTRTAGPTSTRTPWAPSTASCPKARPGPQLRRHAPCRPRRRCPSGTLVYNPRTDGAFGPLTTRPPSSTSARRDLDTAGKLKPTSAARAADPARHGRRVHQAHAAQQAAGRRMPDLDGFNTLPMIVEGFNTNHIRPSSHVGLHPQLALLRRQPLRRRQRRPQPDPDRGAGPVHDLPVVRRRRRGSTPTARVTATPIEFGATNLISSDSHQARAARGRSAR